LSLCTSWWNPLANSTPLEEIVHSPSPLGNKSNLPLLTPFICRTPIYVTASWDGRMVSSATMASFLSIAPVHSAMGAPREREGVEEAIKRARKCGGGNQESETASAHIA
jgi:hypothetical protein